MVKIAKKRREAKAKEKTISGRNLANKFWQLLEETRNNIQIRLKVKEVHKIMYIRDVNIQDALEDINKDSN